MQTINKKISGNNVDEIELESFNHLYSIQHFSTKTLLTNGTKTKFEIFSTRQTSKDLNFNIVLNEIALEEVFETKLLGLRVDKNINWNSHVVYGYHQLELGLFALRKLSYFCNISTMKSIYFT